jgi:hypothetical protein
MASNLYRVGVGMMGGRTGTYGRYSIGPRVSGLAPQFNKSPNVEEQQMRRFGRKKEWVLVGLLMKFQILLKK